jgi:hypothetical protein
LNDQPLKVVPGTNKGKGMEAKYLAHSRLMFLEERGSMQTISHAIIQGCHEIVQTIQGIVKRYTKQERLIMRATCRKGDFYNYPTYLETT